MERTEITCFHPLAVGSVIAMLNEQPLAHIAVVGDADLAATIRAAFPTARVSHGDCPQAEVVVLARWDTRPWLSRAWGALWRAA